MQIEVWSLNPIMQDGKAEKKKIKENIKRMDVFAQKYKIIQRVIPRMTSSLKASSNNEFAVQDFCIESRNCPVAMSLSLLKGTEATFP